MPNFYYYLISSLPMLQFSAKPPFSFEKFLEACGNFIPEKDLKVISNLPQPDNYEKTYKQRVIAKWCLFDTSLRNELSKIRASFRHLEQNKYLKIDTGTNIELNHIALAAQRNPSVLEGEKFLDEIRWKELENLSLGHYFDLDFLIVYAYKLLILERWDKVNNADGLALVEGVLK